MEQTQGVVGSAVGHTVEKVSMFVLLVDEQKRSFIFWLPKAFMICLWLFNVEMTIIGMKSQIYPEFPLVSPYGDLAQRKTDYWRTNDGKNLNKIANPQAFSEEQFVFSDFSLKFSHYTVLEQNVWDTGKLRSSDGLIT